MEHDLFMLLFNALGEKGMIVLAALGALYVVVRVIVAVTPTHADDEALERGTSALMKILGTVRGVVLGGGKAPPPAPPSGGAAAALLACALLALGGCVPMEAVQQAREEHAISVGHALDASLPLEARQIGADAARAWSAQHQALDGDALPMPTLPPELGPVGGGR